MADKVISLQNHHSGLQMFECGACNLEELKTITDLHKHMALYHDTGRCLLDYELGIAFPKYQTACMYTQTDTGLCVVRDDRMTVCQEHDDFQQNMMDMKATVDGEKKQDDHYKIDAILENTVKECSYREDDKKPLVNEPVAKEKGSKQTNSTALCLHTWEDKDKNDKNKTNSVQVEEKSVVHTCKRKVKKRNLKIQDSKQTETTTTSLPLTGSENEKFSIKRKQPLDCSRYQGNNSIIKVKQTFQIPMSQEADSIGNSVDMSKSEKMDKVEGLNKDKFVNCSGSMSILNKQKTLKSMEQSSVIDSCSTPIFDKSMAVFIGENQRCPMNDCILDAQSLQILKSDKEKEIITNNEVKITCTNLGANKSIGTSDKVLNQWLEDSQNVKDGLLLNTQASEVVQKKKEKIKSPFICSICNKSMRSRSRFKEHLNTHLDKKQYICEICGISFVSGGKLSQHKNNIHTPKSEWVACEICCNRKYPSKERLRDHMRTVHRQAVFKCDICNKAFRRQNFLNKHMKIHQSGRCFKCDICGKNYKSYSGCQEHRITHFKSFTCELCSNKTFATASSLKRHMKIHGDIKEHACHICGHMFIQKFVYWVHMERHHDLTKEQLIAMYPEKHLPRTLLHTLPDINEQVGLTEVENNATLPNHLNDDRT